jgi:hypothetical protein
MDGQVGARQPGDPKRLGPYELLGRLGQGGMGDDERECEEEEERCSGPEPGRYIRSGASMPIRSRVLARTWWVASTSDQRALERARSSLRTRHSA